MSKIFFLLFPLLVWGGTDLYQEGKKLYMGKGCTGCHGISATGNGQYPSLAYRRKTILVQKLKRLRSKQGDTQLAEMMIPFALELNDRQIDALSTFLQDYHEDRGSSTPSFSIRGDGGS